MQMLRTSLKFLSAVTNSVKTSVDNLYIDCGSPVTPGSLTHEFEYKTDWLLMTLINSCLTGFTHNSFCVNQTQPCMRYDEPRVVWTSLTTRHHQTLLSAVLSTYSCTSARTVAVRPFWGAIQTGVAPSLFGVLASSPHSSTSARTVSVWPFWDATKTAVAPSFFAVLASSPHSCTSDRTVSVWPFWAAFQTGVAPFLLGVLASAPHYLT